MNTETEEATVLPSIVEKTAPVKLSPLEPDDEFKRGHTKLGEVVTVSYRVKPTKDSPVSYGITRDFDFTGVTRDQLIEIAIAPLVSAAQAMIRDIMKNDAIHGYDRVKHTSTLNVLSDHVLTEKRRGKQPIDPTMAAAANINKIAGGDAEKALAELESLEAQIAEAKAALAA